MIEQNKYKKCLIDFFFFFLDAISLNKIIQFIIGHMTETNVYYPISTESVKERRQWNRWFISGWYVYTLLINTIHFAMIIMILNHNIIECIFFFFLGFVVWLFIYYQHFILFYMV